MESLRSRHPLLKARSNALWEIRRFFRSRGFPEVDAPNLVPSAGMEPHLDPFEARGWSSGRKAFLPTSPEFYLKKLLASGFGRCFSLAPSFRDEPEGTRHSPEFLILEWYRPGKPLDAILRDCIDLCRILAISLLGTPRIAGSPYTLDTSLPPRILTVSEAFERWVGTDWKALDSPAEWRVLAQSHGAAAGENWSENDCFSYLLLTRVEGELTAIESPVALWGFPPFQGALARECPDAPGVIDRFELYLGGIELANAYAELTDGVEQRRRYRMFQEERRAACKPPHPADEELLEAVDHLPPCSGVAFGVDRFLGMLFGDTLRRIRHGIPSGI